MSSFLQTALVVDDRLVPRDRSTLIEEEATLGDESLDFDAGDALPEESDGNAGADSEPPGKAEALVSELDDRAVIDGFADLGITCAVLQAAGPSEDDRKRVHVLARRTDIVVLDWFLSGESGDEQAEGPSGSSGTSLELIADIVKGDVDSGGRVRLICIYTSNPDLAGILSTVQTRVVEVFASSDRSIAPSVEGFAIAAGNLKIVLVAKEGHSSPGLAPEVSGSALPGWLASAFKDAFGGGLLPELALGAVAAVRDQTHRLLARFARDLDPAFISHRALTGPVSSEGFAGEIVADELASLLAAAVVESSVHQDAVDLEVDRILGDAPEDRYLMSKETGSAKPIPLEGARNVLKYIRDDEGQVDVRARSRDGNGNVILQKQPKKLRNSSVTSLMSLAPDEAGALAFGGEADDRFAALSCLARSSDLEGPDLPPPTLTLGSLITNGPEYWLCVQPVCDAVRLDEPRHFPLVPLTVVDGTDGFNLVAPFRGAHLRLSKKGARFADTTMVKFKPHLPTGTVRGEWLSDEETWSFKISGRRRAPFTQGHALWVGQLRKAKALQLALQVATNLGRVGLDESEYLRVMSERS